MPEPGVVMRNFWESFAVYFVCNVAAWAISIAGFVALRALGALP